MNNKSIAIAAALVAVSMLAGIVATTPITTVFADESETEFTLKCKTGDFTASGESSLATSVNCAVNQGFGE